MSEKTSKKRTRLFVDTKVQGSLVRQLIMHWSLMCLLTFVYLLAWQAFSNGFSLGLRENLNAVTAQYGLLGAVLLVLSPVFIYDSFKLSNRFVGPMVSLRSSLKSLAAGEDGPPLTFRREDFWRELTDDYNKVRAELLELRGAQRRDGDRTEPELVETNG